MKAKIRRIILSLIFAFLMFEIIIIAPKEIGISRQAESPILSQPETEKSQQSMRGVHLLESQGENKEWELWADQAFTIKEGNVWKLQNVKVHFFGQDHVNYVVTGYNGQVNVVTKDVEIGDHVVLTSSNGYQFRTDRIFYKAQTRMLTTPYSISMNGSDTQEEPPMEVTGRGLIADLKTNEMMIPKDVHSKKRLKSGEEVRVESDKMELSAINRFARYVGEVTIDYKGSRVTAPSARFNYDSNLKTVSSVLVEGGAHITDLSKWATAKTVEMLFNENKFILRGAPRVVQDDDEILGEEITFLENGKEIQVNRAKARVTPQDSKEKHLNR